MTVSEATQSKPEEQLWICESCGFVYDPAEGDPRRGIPANTPFDEIPKDWMCPICGARKKDFRRMEAGEEIPADVN